MAVEVECLGCRGLVPDGQGPRHAYMQASPGCWQVYTELAAGALTAPGAPDARWHHVDCYAVQHPGGAQDDRRQRQSVAVHLVSLCLLHEFGQPPTQASARRGQISQRVLARVGLQDWPYLPPPTNLGAVTSRDVHPDGPWGTGRPDAGVGEVSVGGLVDPPRCRPFLGGSRTGRPPVTSDDQTAPARGRCPGCGLAAPETGDDPPAEHVASAACYRLYGQLLARDYSDAGYYRAAHQMVVDTYAAQHAGGTSRREVQTVALCLMTLCLFVEDGVDPAQGPRLHQQMAANRPSFVWLPPPVPAHWPTVADVLKAHDVDEHEQLVRGWAGQVWQAWTPHHAAVRQWNEQALR